MPKVTSMAPATANNEGCSCRQEDRSAERQQGPGTPCQGIHHGEIAGPVAAEQALGIEKMQHTGCEQKQRGPQTEARPGVGQDPDREGRKHERFGRPRKTR